MVVAMSSLALLAAACGGGHSASTGSTRAGGSSTAAGSTNSSSTSSQLLAYAQCMRAHGVPDFPDPDSSGLIPADRVKALTVSRTVFAAADGQCHSLYPTLPGINAPFTTEQKQDYLKAAACMRAHGIPNFPDPVISGTQVQLPIPSGVDPNSPQFTQARQICSRMIPGGLPYSGNSG
jgi:hypothetical protein